MGYVVERSSKDLLDRVAENAKVSSAVMFEAIMNHLELNGRGLPVWWPAQNLEDGELPIDAA